MSAPNGAGHARPWLLESQNALDVVAVDLLARDGVDDGRLNAKEGERCRPRLGRGNTGEGGNDMGTCLGLPVRL